MELLRALRSRLRRRPVDPERVLARAQADARRRALHDRAGGQGGYGGGDGGGGDGGL